MCKSCAHRVESKARASGAHNSRLSVHMLVYHFPGRFVVINYVVNDSKRRGGASMLLHATVQLRREERSLVLKGVAIASTASEKWNKLLVKGLKFS